VKCNVTRVRIESSKWHKLRQFISHALAIFPVLWCLNIQLLCIAFWDSMNAKGFQSNKVEFESSYLFLFSYRSCSQETFLCLLNFHFRNSSSFQSAFPGIY
jgi:hypothetical protein